MPEIQATGSNAQFKGAFENPWGAPPAANGGWVQLPAFDNSISATQDLSGEDLLGAGREGRVISKGRVSVGGAITVPIDDIIFGHWLKLAFGAPVTSRDGDTGPYTHLFETGKTTLPSLSLETGFSDIGVYYRYSGLMVNSLSFDMDDGDGSAKCSLDLIGQSVAEFTNTIKATTPAANNNFNQSSAGILRDGVQIGNVSSASLQISNNLDAPAVIRDDALIGRINPGLVTVTGSITVLFENNEWDNLAKSGPCALELSWGNNDTSLKIKLPEVILPDYAGKPVSGPAGIMAQYNFEVGKPTASAKAIFEYSNHQAGY